MTAAGKNRGPVKVDDWRKALTKATGIRDGAKVTGFALASHADYQTGHNARPGVKLLAAPGRTPRASRHG